VGLGAVIGDHQGRMWAAKSLTRLGLLDPLAAETIVATMAAILCNEMGIRQVQPKGDAKEVVDAVNSSLPDDSGTAGHLNYCRPTCCSTINLSLGSEARTQR
jgi:hypothetical protein